MLYKELSAGLSDKPINNIDKCYVKGWSDKRREPLEMLLPLMHQLMTGSDLYLSV